MRDDAGDRDGRAGGMTDRLDAEPGAESADHVLFEGWRERINILSDGAQNSSFLPAV